MCKQKIDPVLRENVLVLLVLSKFPLLSLSRKRNIEIPRFSCPIQSWLLSPAYVVRREGNVFTGVCLSIGGWEGVPLGPLSQIFSWRVLLVLDPRSFFWGGGGYPSQICSLGGGGVIPARPVARGVSLVRPVARE